MPLLADMDPPTGVVIRASKATAVRYERDRPGELVHMDAKKVGRIPDRGGWRALGRDVAADLGAKQIFIKPHRPWQNGKVERLNRTLQTEWAYRQVFTSNAERAATLAPRLEHYNTRRRRSTLGVLPPTSRLSTT